MEVSGQKLWLDEAMTHSTGFLKTLVNKESSRDLTNAEKNMKHIVASYCYLYHKAQELGFLDEDSDLIFTEKIN